MTINNYSSDKNLEILFNNRVRSKNLAKYIKSAFEIRTKYINTWWLYILSTSIYIIYYYIFCMFVYDLYCAYLSYCIAYIIYKMDYFLY